MPKYYPPFLAKSDMPLPSKSLYNQRKYYKEETSEIFSEIKNNYIDLWYETPLYGKVNPQGRHVFPNKRKIIYPATTDPTGAPSIQGFDFAMKALEEYIFFLKRATISGKTGLNGLLNNYKLVSGYTDPFEEYRKYIDNNIRIFNQYIIKTGIYSKITNFDKYVCELLKAIEEVDEKLSFFHFFTHNKTNLSSTGLSFRFLNADQDDDYLKNKFFQHREFAKYVNTAANYGFRLNKNSPWEIIVDVNSKPMLMNRTIKKPRRKPVIAPGYLQEKLIRNAEEFFVYYYNDVMNSSYQYFKRLMIFCYNQYVDNIKYTVDYGTPYISSENIFNIISDEEFGRTKQQQIFLEPFDSSSSSGFGEIYFIKKYEKLLRIEFKNNLNKSHYHTFKNKFDKAVDVNVNNGEAYSLLDDYYYNLTKIYDPHTRELMWNSPKKSLTPEMKFGKIQTKDRPTVGKIVTEFLPDI